MKTRTREYKGDLAQSKKKKRAKKNNSDPKPIEASASTCSKGTNLNSTKVRLKSVKIIGLFLIQSLSLTSILFQFLLQPFTNTTAPSNEPYSTRNEPIGLVHQNVPKTVVTSGPDIDNNEISRDIILDLTDTFNESEAIVNLVDPEEGTEYLYDVAQLKQPIIVIAPKVEVVNIHDSTKYHDREPVVEVQVSCKGNRKMGFRNFPRFYTNHLNDQTFIKKTHRWINGMMGAWRDYTMVCIAKARDSGAYDNDSAIGQLKFARDKVIDVMKGLDKVQNVPISILHYDAIMYTVEGVRDQELADFIVCMANCDGYKIIVAPMNSNRKRFKVITKFVSGKVTQRKVYGK